MEGFDLKYFVGTFNFDQLMALFTSGEYQVIFHNRIVIGVGVLLLALIAYPKSRDLGTTALVYTLVGIIYGVGGVVLKNSAITDIGPFLLLITLALGAIGYVIFKKLLLAR
jgi:hypothetical protein